MNANRMKELFVHAVIAGSVTYDRVWKRDYAQRAVIIAGLISAERLFPTEEEAELGLELQDVLESRATELLEYVYGKTDMPIWMR